MKNEKLTKTLNSVKKTLSDNSPTILTGVGIAGMFTTTVLAIKATPKVLTLIEEAENEKKDDLTKTEIIKVAWKPYLPAAITFGVSAGFLIGANSVNAKRYAALSTAYKLSETTYMKYREKVVETVGDKKEKNIRDKVAKEKYENKPVNKDKIFDTKKGTSLCIEPITGRQFYSNIETIKRAENEINRQMLHDISGYSSLNEFFDELNLERTEISGDDLGWNTYWLIDIDFTSIVTADGEPALVINYVNAPKWGYMDM